MRIRTALAAAACALLSAAGPAAAQTAEDLAASARAAFAAAAAPRAPAAFRGARAAPAFYFFGLRPPGPRVLPPGSLGRPAAVAPLPSLLDNIRRTAAAFRAGSATVRVFGAKSANRNNWFVGFAEDGGDAQFRDGRAMIHWYFIKRTQRVEFGGRGYSVYIDGSVTDHLASRLVVKPDDRSEGRSSWSIRELSDDAYAAGWPVTLGGREYRLLYSRDFDEDARGEFAGYDGGRSIVLMWRDGGGYHAYHWFQREIPSGRVLVTSPAAAGADGLAPGSVTLGLSLTPSGALELYGPLPPGGP
jgi:hypothetical protein